MRRIQDIIISKSKGVEEEIHHDLDTKFSREIQGKVFKIRMT